ncbi:MAG: genomic island protein [Pseudomonadota bacterium]
MAQLAVKDDVTAPVRAASSNPDGDVARKNWERYWYVKQRGHVQYCEQAKRFEELYLGGGKQWLPDDKAYMEQEIGRKCIELNEIADAINSSLGYQVNNRVDIGFKPRNQGASEDIATILSKVAMQIADNVKFPWAESQVFADGLIQQRGFYELRMKFDDSMQGEIGLDTLDPMDVIPDPDAKTYDPDGWADVTITRWMTYDEIESMYGTAARNKVEERGATLQDRDFGFDIDEVERNKFGNEGFGTSTLYDAYYEEAGVARVRIIDRQYWKLTSTKVVVYPTGDIRVAANASPEKIKYWKSQGCIVMQRPVKRVRWSVSAGQDVVLHDDWSPYNHFTVIPYFPYFRRGKTKGAVDDLMGPQDLLNKSVSQYLHILNSTANSGWVVEQHSLTNMSTDDLAEEGAKTGIVMEFRKGATPPKKIEANTVPTGIDRLVQLGSDKIRSISGQTDPMRGMGGANQSGLAAQSQQFAAQMSQAIPIDNLARTRHMVAQRFLELIQGFMDEPRIWNIAKTLPNGSKTTEELRTNWLTDAGEVLNNLTIGEYDVVITDQPAQVTFENSQYNQAMDMRKAGISIPDDIIIRYSNLADKTDIITRMQNTPQGNPMDDAKAALAQAQATLAAANATSKNVEALFSAIRTAQIITTMPAVVPIADAISRSAGFKDADGGAIYADPGTTQAAAASGQVTPPPNNTHPATPDNPQRGMDTGIEAGPAAQPA